MKKTIVFKTIVSFFVFFCPRFHNEKIVLKKNENDLSPTAVDVILSDPSFPEWHVGFTRVYLKLIKIIKTLEIVEYCFFLGVVEIKDVFISNFIKMLQFNPKY